MIIGELEWDDQNMEHVALHKVSPKEVEDVCFGFHFSQGEGRSRYILIGQTDEGRYINVVVKRVAKRLFKPITAFEMSESYKRRYKKQTERSGRKP